MNISLASEDIFFGAFPATFMIVGCQVLRTEPVAYGAGMDEHAATLDVNVTIGPNGDAEELAQATRQLRRELLELDVDSVETPPAGEPPPGSRAVDIATVGALVVNMADSQLLAAVIRAVRSWLAGSSRRSIKLGLDGDVLELTGVSSMEQRRLTDEWLARHTGR